MSWNPLSWFDSSATSPATPATPANPQVLDNAVQTAARPPRTPQDRLNARNAADAIGTRQQQDQVDARAKLTANVRKTLQNGSLANALPPEYGFTPNSQNAEEEIGWNPTVTVSPIQDGVLPPSITSIEDVSALVAQSIKPNPLDPFNNYTYHLKFWVTTEKNTETIADTSKHAVDNIPKIVIAESGVTAGFNIREFTFKNLTGTTGMTRNMPSVNWTMVITEPLGFSLPDRIRSSAQAYGIKNWQRGKYFIEVYFTGYNEDGSPVASGLFYKLYRVTITDMNFGGDQAGATYEISGLFDGQHGFENTVAMSDKTITVGASTVGEFFNKLTDALNTNAIDLAMGGTAPLTKYEFVLPRDLQPWGINPGKVLENDQYASNMTPKKDGNEVKLTISSGTDVGQMVYYVLSLANQAESWMLGTDSTSSAQGTPLNSIRKNVKIHCKMAYIGFDTYAGDYVKKITYTLIPYEEIRVRDDIPSVRKADSASIQADKIKYMLRNGRIAKKYEWIYTGQNLDIIRFDFKINHFWTISTPAYGGFNTASNAVQGAVAAENSAPWAAHDGRYRTTVLKAKELGDKKVALQNSISNPIVLDILRRANPGTTKEAYDARNSLQADIANAKSELASVEQQIKENAAAQYAAKFRTRNEFVDFANPVEGALGTNALVKEILESNAKLTSAFKEGGIFAEDQKILDVDTRMPFINTVKPNKEANSANTNQGTASAKPPDTSRDPINLPVSRTLFGAVTGNFDSINKEMMNISMDIRGDPYWMGHGNVEQNAKVPDNLKDLSKDYVELLGGDNMFYLKFRSGQIQNEDTGFMDFTADNQVLEGYYSVWEVTNTFKEGQFIQTLKSFKDTQSQHANPIMKSIEARKNTGSGQPKVNAPVAGAPVPPSVAMRSTTPGVAPLSMGDLRARGDAIRAQRLQQQ